MDETLVGDVIDVDEVGLPLVGEVGMVDGVAMQRQS